MCLTGAMLKGGLAMGRKFFESMADDVCSLDRTCGVNNPVAPDSRERCIVGDGQTMINLAAFDSPLNPFRNPTSNNEAKKRMGRSL